MKLEDAITARFPGCDKTYLDKYLQICSSNVVSGYSEKHHILPRSDWPEYENFAECPWNCVSLSFTDHVVAHYFYAKCVNTKESWCSVHILTNSKHTKSLSEFEVRKIVEIYEDFKSSYRGEIHHNYGKTFTPEHRAKLSESRKGTTCSDEHKHKLSLASKRALRTGEHWKLYDQLFDLWMQHPGISRRKFRTLAVDSGYPDADYKGMISSFNSDLNGV